MERIELNQNDIDPVAATQRLAVLQSVRTNLRQAQIKRDGILRPTPQIDAAIDWLEGAIAFKLPRAPTV